MIRAVLKGFFRVTLAGAALGVLALFELFLSNLHAVSRSVFEKTSANSRAHAGVYAEAQPATVSPAVTPSPASAGQGRPAASSTALQPGPVSPTADIPPLSMTVTRIGRGSNQFARNGYVALSASIRNDTQKTIRAIKALIVIFDVFGDELVRLGFDNSKTLRPGQSIRETGEWPILLDQKAQNAITADGADTSKLTYALIPKIILFEDGSKLENPGNTR